MSVHLADLDGFRDPAPRSNATDAVRFLSEWFRHCDMTHLASMTLLPAGKGTPRPITLPLGGLIEQLQTRGIQELIDMSGTQWNIYACMSTLSGKPVKGKRGGKNLMLETPGIWADLDVKPGAFGSTDEIRFFLRSLPIQPTLVTATGSGGLQAFWRMAKPMTPHDAETLCIRWWALCKSMAGGRAVDKVANADRLMRLPGSLRWPKKGETGQVFAARLLVSDGPETTPEAIETATEAVWSSYTARVSSVSLNDRMREIDTSFLARELVPGSLGAMAALVEMRVLFAQTYSWSDLLTPHGWSRCVDESTGGAYVDDDGRSHWSRPGGEGRKSATTDWPGSPDVMSLFSEAPETKLYDLHEAKVPLTKWRVWLRLTWNDDEQAFVRAFAETLRQMKSGS